MEYTNYIYICMHGEFDCNNVSIHMIQGATPGNSLKLLPETHNTMYYEFLVLLNR